MSNDADTASILPPVGAIGTYRLPALSDLNGNQLCAEQVIPAKVIGHCGFGARITLQELANPRFQIDCHHSAFTEDRP